MILHANGDPAPGVTVKIYDSKNKMMASVVSDEDGWYMWAYKYTGKATTFTTAVPAYSLAQSVTLKTNGYLVVHFTIP